MSKTQESRALFPKIGVGVVAVYSKPLDVATAADRVIRLPRNPRTEELVRNMVAAAARRQ